MRTQNIFEKAAFAAWLIVAVSGAALIATQAPSGGGGQEEEQLLSTIAFVSTRDNLTINPLLGAEIYLMNANGSRDHEHGRRHFPGHIAGRQKDRL